MKKLIALLAVLGFVPYAYAADGADFSHSGEFRVQYTSNEEADFDSNTPPSRSQDLAQRLRWGTTVRAGEKMSAHFTLVHNAHWGDNADQVPDGVGDLGSGSTTSNLLIVNEAYGTWMASDSLAFKFGRGGATIADGRFVSTNDFYGVSKAFDGVYGSYDHEIARFGFFGVTGARGIYGADQNYNHNLFGRFYGVTADFKNLPDFLKAASLHVVQVSRDQAAYDVGGTLTALPKQDNKKIGVMLTGDRGGVDYRVNYEMEDGENDDGATKTDIKTSMIDAEVGYGVPALWNGRVYVGYHTDSGTSSGADDETYDGFHYDVHNNAGLMDVFGWGNLTYMRVGAGMNPADDVSVAVEYLKFTQTEKEDGFRRVMNGATGDATAVAGDTAKDDLGTEIDLTVTKKYTNNFNISARYSYFTPGDEFGATDDKWTQIYLESKLTF